MRRIRSAGSALDIVIRTVVTEFAGVLVEKKKRHGLARRYVRALLTKGNLYQWFLYDQPALKYVQKAYKNDQEALYKVVRTIEHVNHHRKLIDDEAVFNGRMQDETTHLSLNS